jgi:Ni,Fe-hydrogenase I cytochrome b subunit
MLKILGWGLLAAFLAPLVLLHWIGLLAIAILILGGLAFLDLPSGH